MSRRYRVGGLCHDRFMAHNDGPLSEPDPRPRPHRDRLLSEKDSNPSPHGDQALSEEDPRPLPEQLKNDRPLA